MDIELWGGISGVVLIMSLVQLAKQVFGLPGRYAGLAAVGLGVALSLAYHHFAEAELFRTVVRGLALGLSAVGLWSTGKHLARNG